MKLAALRFLLFFSLAFTFGFSAKADWKYYEFGDAVLSAQSCSSREPRRCFGLKCNIADGGSVYWYIDAPGSQFGPETTITHWKVGSNSFVSDMVRAGPAENGIQHYEERFKLEEEEFFAAIRKGRKVTVRSDQIASFSVSLRGSKATIDHVIRECLRKVKLQTKASSNPSNMSIPDLIQQVFEQSNCVATEADLYDIVVNAGFDAGIANNAMITLANSGQVEVISRDPFTYKFLGSQHCAKLAQIEPTPSAGSSSLDGLKAVIAKEVAGFCSKGSQVFFEPEAIKPGSNGTVLVDMGSVKCDWEFSVNAFCGARLCEQREYIVNGQDITLRQVTLR